MAYVSGCSVCCCSADGPDRSWSEMSWDLRRRVRHQSKTKHLTFFPPPPYSLSTSLPWRSSSPISCFLKREVVKLRHLRNCPSPSFRIYEELHTWVIESMLFIKSIILPSLSGFCTLAQFFFFSILTLPGLVLLSSLSPLLLSSYLVLLPRSPTLRRAWQIVSVHETR